MTCCKVGHTEGIALLLSAGADPSLGVEVKNEDALCSLFHLVRFFLLKFYPGRLVRSGRGSQ